MPTPAFKVLLNAIRLGQPPEPVSGVRALAEALDRQQAEIAELKQRVSLLMSRLQFSEAKSARLEAALAGRAAGPTPLPFSVGQLDEPPPPSLPPLVSGQSPHREADLGRSGAHQAQASARQPSQPAFVVPTLLPDRRNTPAPDGIPSLVPQDEPSIDDASGTLVVPRADIDAVVQRIISQDAPFPLAQPGTGKRAHGDTGIPFKPHDHDAAVPSARVLEALPLQDDTYAQTNEHPAIHDDPSDDHFDFSKRK